MLAISLASYNTYTQKTSEQNVSPAHIQWNGSGDVKIGAATCVAGFELQYGGRFFGGLSGLVITDSGRRMIAVTDHGH